MSKKWLFVSICVCICLYFFKNNTYIQTVEKEIVAVTESTYNLIVDFEGKRNRAYRDTRGLWTTGIGHLIKPTEQYLIHAVLTDEQVEELFKSDSKWCDGAIVEAVKVPLNQNQYNALFSLCYNIGETNFKASSLVRVLNTGDYVTAANHFMDWVRPAILTDRRKKEKALFLTDI